MVNWRLLSAGGLVTFIGSILWKIQASEWVQANMPYVSGFLAPYSIVFLAMAMFGASLIAAALFYQKWGWALLFGTLFAAGAYFVTAVI